MSRIPQNQAAKGSQKWIQKLINEKPDLLNSPIRTQLDLPREKGTLVPRRLSKGGRTSKYKILFGMGALVKSKLPKRAAVNPYFAQVPELNLVFVQVASRLIAILKNQEVK